MKDSLFGSFEALCYSGVMYFTRLVHIRGHVPRAALLVHHHQGLTSLGGAHIRPTYASYMPVYASYMPVYAPCMHIYASYVPVYARIRLLYARVRLIHARVRPLVGTAAAPSLPIYTCMAEKGGRRSGDQSSSERMSVVRLCIAVEHGADIRLDLLPVSFSAGSRCSSTS
jgi:hypothetical protein